MSEQRTEEPPDESIRLSTNCIVNGQFIIAGSPTPFKSESDLPPSLKGFVATGNEPAPFNPSERNIYDLSPAARRQARALEADAQFQDWAEQVAAEPLREDIAEALQDAHDRSIGLAKAQAQFNQDAIDNVHEAVAAAAEPEPFFVRRGGEWARVERAKLKPGETCFLKRENGEMEAAGVINSRAEPPAPEIRL